MNNNNTNFPKQLSQALKDDIEKIPDVMKKILHTEQQIPYDYIMKKNVRGLLVYHATGTGKTLTAVSISERFIHYGRDVIVVSPKSLHANFKKELKFFNKKFDKDLTDEKLEKILQKYKFVTSNASNMIDQFKDKNSIENLLSKINKISLDNKIIIVDEAHNLFNSIVNGSKNANEFYDLAMNAKNIKLVFLTASPLINQAFEMCVALNMCVGKIYDNIKYSKNKSYNTILPERYDDFERYFIDVSSYKIKNIDKLKNRILGLISYNGSLFTDKYEAFHIQISKPQIRENFPTLLPLIIEKIKMSEKQNNEYTLMREIEKIEKTRFSGGGIEMNQTKSQFSSYRIKSRQISNVFIEDGKIDYANLDKYSTKLVKLWDNIKIHPNKLGIIYSEFLKYGLEAIAGLLEFHGYSKFNLDGVNEPGLKYVLYTGSIHADDREKILKIFNKPENKDGSIIQLILLSSSGAEGISLKNIRHLHMLEQYWNWSRSHQVIARGVRYMSHSILPPEDQNVQVYLYLSIFNDNYLKSEHKRIEEIKEKNKKNKLKVNKELLKIDPPTDIFIFQNAIRKEELNNQFLQLMAECSIECSFFNKGVNFNCYSCKETNETLYQNDINIDMQIRNPCIKEEKVLVSEVLINKVVYYYHLDSENKLKVYEQQGDDYINVDDQHIIDLINKKLK